MKKTYMTPAARVIILQESEYLLSGSDGLSGEISGYGKSSGGFSQDDETPSEP